jgi:ADP-ribose pyrophosphatase YjhB (NUDIX family)
MKYRDGNEVLEGDLLRVSGRDARVLRVFPSAHPERSSWGLPKGGVLFETSAYGMCAQESFEDDEEVEFVARAATL